MAAGCVYGDRQMQTWRAGSGLSCRRRLVRTLDAVIIGTRSRHTGDRNDAQRAPSARPGFSMPFRECAQSPRVSHREIRRFSVEFDEGGGLKNRCRFGEKVGSGKC